MGSTRPEREYARARTAYLAAAQQLVLAMAEWEAAHVPLLPGSAGDLEAWTPHQIKATIAAARAWHELVRRRREYESLARDVGAAPK